MKIDFEGVDKLNSEYVLKDVKRKKSSEEKAERFDTEDKVEISSKATDFKKMQELAMKAPDVREEKVAAIKLQVDNGTYQIAHDKVAERLIQEHVLE